MISVIIPAYNIEQYIEQCVKSILNQTYTDFEILIVDDGSTDDTPIICDRLASEDDRIRVFHKKNGGVSSARNLALENAKGELIAMIDGDDFVEPTLFEDAVRAIKETKTQVFMFEYFVEQGDKTSIHKVQEKKYGVVSSEDALIYSITPDNRFLTMKIFETSLVQKSRFDEKIILGEDTLFICQIISRAESVFYSPNAYYHYQIRGNSAITSKFNLKKMSGLEAYDKNMRFCKENGFRIASYYAAGAIVDLAVALCRQTVGEVNQKEAYKIAKKYIRKVLIKVLLTRLISLKTKMKAVLGVLSMSATIKLCGMLGEKEYRG